MNTEYDDDCPLGRLLSRREVLALFGLTGAGLLAACAAPTVPATRTTGAQPQPAPTSVPTQQPSRAPTVAAVLPTSRQQTASPTPAAIATPAGSVAAIPACVARPEVTEGPYYVDEHLNRTDIRSDPGTGAIKPGALLALTFRVSQIGSGACTPFANAKVDIWHCDADGVYSDVTDRSFNTKGQKFLRGYQMTDASGVAAFTTIYPGWYPGRAIHIHFKVSPTPNTIITSQVFFDDAFSDTVLAQAPYKQGNRTLNTSDGIYKPQLLTTTIKTSDGYATSFDIGVQMA